MVRTPPPTADAGVDDAQSSRGTAVVRAIGTGAILSAPTAGGGRPGVPDTNVYLRNSPNTLLATRRATTSPTGGDKSKSTGGIGTSVWSSTWSSLSFSGGVTSRARRRGSNKSAHSAERTAFLVRLQRDAMDLEAGSSGKLASCADMYHISYHELVQQDENGPENFELWIDQDTAPGDTTVKVRVRVAAEARVVSPTMRPLEARRLEPIRACIWFESISAAVTGASAKRHRHGSGREVGPYVERLELRATVMPPPGSVVVTDSADTPEEPLETHITTEEVITRERNVGFAANAGGEAGVPCPAVNVGVDRRNGRALTVTTEVAGVHPVRWDADIHRRHRSRFKTATTESFATYAEWTAHLVTWSTGLPYEPASLFADGQSVWPTNPPKVTAPPAAASGAPSLTGRWTINPPAPSRRPLGQEGSSKGQLFICHRLTHRGRRSQRRRRGSPCDQDSWSALMGVTTAPQLCRYCHASGLS